MAIKILIKQVRLFDKTNQPSEIAGYGSKTPVNQLVLSISRRQNLGTLFSFCVILGLSNS